MCLYVEQKPSATSKNKNIIQIHGPSIQLTGGNNQLQLISRKGRRQPNSLRLKFIMGNFDKVNHANRISITITNVADIVNI